MIHFRRPSRRDWLKNVSGGFGYLALQAMLAEQARAETPQQSALAAKTPHYQAKARRVIFLCTPKRVGTP